MHRHISTGLLLAPWLITLSLFWLYPIAFSLLLSFQDYSLLNPEDARWIRFDNFIALWNDPVFWKSLRVTLTFLIVTVPFTIGIGLILADLLNDLRWLSRFARTAVFIPSIVSIAVVALVFVQFYTRGGYVHTLALWAGIGNTELGLLLDERTALGAIMLMDIFIHSGYYALLFLGGIKGIPQEQFEEAEMVGTARWRRLVFIIIPQLRPLILFALVLNSIKAFQVYTEVLLMTKGGPLHSTTTMIYRVYELGFKDFALGQASAMAYVLLILVGLLVCLQMRWFKERI
jgi:multiple sugar transport system permease protein